VARTIADLSAAEKIEAAHLLEAINYRTLDRHASGGVKPVIFRRFENRHPVIAA